MINIPKFNDNGRRFLRICALVFSFALIAVGVFLWLRGDLIDAAGGMEVPVKQQIFYALGGGCLIAAIVALCINAFFVKDERTPRVWECPLLAAGLGLALMLLAYAFLGVYPIGEKSILIVDMHHQYAPLLSELRHMFLEGGNFTYSFHIGLGANFIACFSYYLSSPLNLLLVLFSEQQLAEAILFITLIKNALSAAAFAACAQYICRKRNAAIITVSVMYSMMMYMLAYSWNIMWLDVVMLLPIVVMCLERMLREGKWLAYSLTLTLALFSNYYIGFMLCIFLVFYFVVWQTRKSRPLRERGIAFGRFAGGSLLGGGLAAALLIPTALALSRTSAAGDDLPSFAANFDMFNLFSQMFYGVTPTIRSGNLPNLYCGVVTVMLVPVYATQQSIPLRRRISYVALLAVMLFSCTINQWDLVWHGLHSPNDLPYRFSFLVCFVMLLMAVRVLTCLTRITPKQILGSLTASAAYLLLWEKFGGDHAPDDKLLYFNLLLLAVYAVVLLVGACRRMPARAGRLLLTAVVALELILSSSLTLDKMDSTEYFTMQKNYVDNEKTAADAAAVERAQQIAEESGELFSRLEYLPRSTCMDTALHHYNGITTFASSNPYQTTLLMGDLGYAVNGVNSYLYHSFVPPIDSLLNIRHIILKTKITSHPQLTYLETVTVGDETRYIYENKNALPLGFFADDDILDYNSANYQPFNNQSSLYSAILGKDTFVYSPLTLTPSNPDSSIHISSFYKSGSTDTVNYTGEILNGGQYFAYVDCRAASSISVKTLNADGESVNTWNVTTHEPYIIDMGTLSAGQRAQVAITASGTVSGNIHVVRLNNEALNYAINTIKANGLQVTKFRSTRVEGTITAPKDGLMFLSIPYDSGWTATVDGKRVETFAISEKADSSDENEVKDGAFLAVDLTAGEHSVVLTYHAPGQTLGLLVSLGSLAVILSLTLPQWIKRRRAATKAPASK